MSQCVHWANEAGSSSTVSVRKDQISPSRHSSNLASGLSGPSLTMVRLTKPILVRSATLNEGSRIVWPEVLRSRPTFAFQFSLVAKASMALKGTMGLLGM